MGIANIYWRGLETRINAKEAVMIALDDDVAVCLVQDIPELGLRQGDVGVVRSTWFEPSTAYEVEFLVDGTTTIHTLLNKEQVRIVSGIPIGHAFQNVLEADLASATDSCVAVG